jgi:phosphohistidine phosphatase
MKVLVLVRHAKSDWGDQDLPDFDRPLNERGKRDAPRMAAYLKQSGVVPQRIISSPAKRTRKTAKIFAEYSGSDDSIVDFDSAIYEATTDDLLNVIRRFDDVECCMLVGHNPGITNLANYFINNKSSYIENVPAAGVVVLKFNVLSWQLLKPGSADLVYFVTPAGIK